MVTLGSIWNFSVTIKDCDTATGSRLFGGSSITCFVSEMTFGGKIEQASANNVLPNIDYVGSNVGSTWYDAITNNSFTGVNNHEITLRGNWTVDIGSYFNGALASPVLSPYKILILATSGKTFYLNDERIIRQIAYESANQFYNVGSGVPVVITDYSMNVTKRDNNLVSWSLSLREDKV